MYFFCILGEGFSGFEKYVVGLWYNFAKKIPRFIRFTHTHNAQIKNAHLVKKKKKKKKTKKTKKN